MAIFLARKPDFVLYTNADLINKRIDSMLCPNNQAPSPWQNYRRYRGYQSFGVPNYVGPTRFTGRIRMLFWLLSKRSAIGSMESRITSISVTIMMRPPLITGDANTAIIAQMKSSLRMDLHGIRIDVWLGGWDRKWTSRIPLRVNPPPCRGSSQSRVQRALAIMGFSEKNMARPL